VLSRRAAAALLCALPFDAAAQATPQAFLEEIYKPYLAHDFKGQSYTQVNRFFAPDLARAIERDVREAQRRMEVPALDGDPFIDAQDWDITKLSISAKVEGTKATAFVGFENLGKPVRLTVDLIQTPVGWRIADIEAPSGSLRALYKLPQGPERPRP
jgi:hypothetical protein